MENPLVHDFAGGSYIEQPFSELIQEAIDEGHDGVIFDNVNDDAMWVVMCFRAKRNHTATKRAKIHVLNMNIENMIEDASP